MDDQRYFISAIFDSSQIRAVVTYNRENEKAWKARKIRVRYVNSLLYSSLGWEPLRFRGNSWTRNFSYWGEPWPDLIPIFNSANLHESRAPANVCELLVSIEGVNVRYTVSIPHAILSGLTWWTCWKIVHHSPPGGIRNNSRRNNSVPRDIVAFLIRRSSLILSNGIRVECHANFVQREDSFFNRLLYCTIFPTEYLESIF